MINNNKYFISAIPIIVWVMVMIVLNVQVMISKREIEQLTHRIEIIEQGLVK